MTTPSNPTPAVPPENTVPVTVHVGVHSGTVYVKPDDARHVCGSHGFPEAFMEGARCPRCDANARAEEIARQASAAPAVPPATPDDAERDAANAEWGWTPEKAKIRRMVREFSADAGDPTQEPPMTSTDPIGHLDPGSNVAVAAGCTCPRIDNHYGEGRPLNGGRKFIMSEDCPLHGQPKEQDDQH
jgi:hypothetical protein